MSDLPGQTLGHYRIVERIGAGGMGEVYSAVDTSLDREVAVKVLPEEVAQSPTRLERFEREAKAVAKLSHPNILEIHDYGREGEITYAVTELLAGETLRERLDGGTLGWRKASEIGAAIAEGLAAAHQAGIVHRDLKPSNVFLTSDGRVKVLDFGLARQVSAGKGESAAQEPTISLHTEPGRVLGTAGYMSPEQVRGEAVDARSDIFALGCVLYEMVSGRRAFARDTAAETMTAILKEETADLSTCGEAIPSELVGAIRRCLEKRREARFQSASDLAFALRSLSSASAASPKGVTRRSGADWRKAALGLAVVAVVAFTLVWLNPGGWRSGVGTPGGEAGSGVIDSLAVLPFVDVGGDEDTEYLSDGIPASIIDRLSKLSELRVVPRSTAFRFRGAKQDLTDVGRRLGVQALLTGEIRARDEALVIRVELVDVTSDRQLWGERLTGTMDDILTTEERIATRVSESLRIELSGEDRARLAKGGTSSPQAYRHYLRGLYQLNQHGRQDRAVESFSAAIEEDPGFALAYSGLANSWMLLAGTQPEPWEDALPKARRAVEQALALDDSVAEAHASLAWFCEYEWDPVTAEQEYRRALELDPGFLSGRSSWAWFLALQGRVEEAIAETRGILEMDPLLRPANTNLAVFLCLSGQHREAMEQVEQTLELYPGDEDLELLRGEILAVQGSYDEAVAVLERGRSSEAGYQLRALGWAYAGAGRVDEARAVLAELEALARQVHVSPVHVALVHAALGDNDRAFEWLERALIERDERLWHLKVEPEWDPIRDDPRWAELISRISYFAAAP